MNRKKPPTPAELARIAAGYTLEQLAPKVGLRAKSGARTLRGYELRGGASMGLAETWGHIVKADPNLIYYSPQVLARRAAYRAEMEVKKEDLPIRTRHRRDPFLQRV